ncbi:MAG TPA: GntR family transcriptional regulator [Gaiellales bacterium]|jgi:DNA-binding FadR family transcriptional regulator|nr:GntR family transcriptional regulator [Gaiellales bacterium]
MIGGIGSDGDGLPFSPLRLQNAAEQIAERLVTAIALGEFVPGQRLPAERELAAMLGVSRSTVREALHRLAATGYVKIHRGRNGGAVVQADWGPGTAEMVERTLAPNWEHFELLFDLRRLVEQQIARTAAERLDEDHAAEIEAARDRYRDAGSDREKSRVADSELHAAIARATRNALLANLSRHLRAQVSLGFEAEPYSTSIRERAIGQHDELVRAIVERRPQNAADLAGEHFSLTEDAIRKLLGRVRT